MVFVYVHYGVKSDRPSQEHFHLVGYLFWRYPPRKLLFPRTLRPPPGPFPTATALSPSVPRCRPALPTFFSQSFILYSTLYKRPGRYLATYTQRKLKCAMATVSWNVNKHILIHSLTSEACISQEISVCFLPCHFRNTMLLLCRDMTFSIVPLSRHLNRVSTII